MKPLLTKLKQNIECKLGAHAYVFYASDYVGAGSTPKMIMITRYCMHCGVVELKFPRPRVRNTSV